MISLRICSCFPLSSARSRNIPVMFSPGRARLLMNPSAMGSLSRSMPMIGIVLVAAFTALTTHLPLAKIASTLSRTRSAARSGKSSGLPSAYRCSKAMFCPSTYPDSRSPCRKPSQLPVDGVDVRAIAHEASRVGELTEAVHSGQPPTRGQRDYLGLVGLDDYWGT